MQEKSLFRRIFSSALTFVIAVIVIVGIASGMGVLGVPLWPFIFLLFFYSSIDGFKPEKLKGTALGGFIGIFVGMSQGIFTQLTGNATAGLIIFGALALVLGTAFIMGTVFWANIFGLLLMTIMTLFTMTPNVWAGVPGRADMGSLEAFVRVIASYALGVILFIIVSAFMKKKAAKVGQKSQS